MKIRGREEETRGNQGKGEWKLPERGKKRHREENSKGEEDVYVRRGNRTCMSTENRWKGREEGKRGEKGLEAARKGCRAGRRTGIEKGLAGRRGCRCEEGMRRE